MLTIAKWNETFEDSNSRKLVKQKYLQMPFDLNSNGYINLMAHGEAGLMAYGVFLAICQLSAARRQEHRGKVCRNDGTPLTKNQLASHLRMDISHLSAAIELLKSPDICWLVEESDPDVSQSSATNPPATSQNLPDKTIKLNKENKQTDRRPEREMDGGSSGKIDRCESQSVGQSKIFDELSALDADAVDRDCARVREISNLSNKRLSSNLVVMLCMLSRWKAPEMFRQVARFAGSQDCDYPSRYVESSIKKRCKELGIDPDKFNSCVTKVIEERSKK